MAARKRRTATAPTEAGRVVPFADALESEIHPDKPREAAVAPVASGADTARPTPRGPADASRAPDVTVPLADRVSPAFLAVVNETAKSLTRLVRAPLLALAEAVARGDCQTDTPRWRELAGEVFRPLMSAADKTAGKGLADVDAARALCPPAPFGIQSDPALIAAILKHRAAGSSAVKIAKELAAPFGRKRLEPSWVRSVWVRKGDPAPADVQAADAARERKRLAASLERARALGMIQ